MNEVSSIQVAGRNEGDTLISYLASMEVWVTPFLLEQDGALFVKAALPKWQLERALLCIRESGLWED